MGTAQLGFSIVYLFPYFPKDSSNSNLANRFSSYFIEKICNIRSGFPSLSPRATLHKDVPAFSEFYRVSTTSYTGVLYSKCYYKYTIYVYSM